MSNTPRAARSALVVTAGLAAIAIVASPADAQRNPPRPAVAASAPSAAPPRTPYPGATVLIYPGAAGTQQAYSPGYPQGYPRAYPRSRGARYGDPQGQGVYYAPVYPAYGGVNDASGRPLYMLFENGPQAPQAPAPTEYPAATPDLSGSPYVVIDGGTMIADFGNGDRRAVPACAIVESASAPDGHPRTLFYRPPAYQLVLRPGQRGQVIGRPQAGARVCYKSDAYGRVVLDY